MKTELLPTSSSLGMNFLNVDVIRNYKSDNMVSFMQFLNWFIAYAKDELREKKFSDEEIAKYIFLTNIQKNQLYQRYLKHSLYAAKLYAEKLIHEIKEDDNIADLETFTRNVVSDYEWLICEYEYWVKNNLKVHPQHNARKSMSTRELFWSANQLMFLDFAKDVKHIDLRNIKPLFVTVVRQFIEIMGRHIVGYEKIEKVSGGLALNKTHEAWKFLLQQEKDGKHNVVLPVSASTINMIYQWSNAFIHKAHIQNCYIQYFALETMARLINRTDIHEIDFSDIEKIKLPTGRISADWGNIYINDYDMLKTDFEAFLLPNDGVRKYNVIWYSDMNDVYAIKNKKQQVS